jgi:hypothetical protein
MDDGDICSLADLATITTNSYCLLAIIVSHRHLVYCHLQLISIA